MRVAASRSAGALSSCVPGYPSTSLRTGPESGSLPEASLRANSRENLDLTSTSTHRVDGSTHLANSDGLPADRPSVASLSTTIKPCDGNGFGYSSHNSTSVGAFFQSLPGSMYWYNGRQYSLDMVMRLVQFIHILYLCSGLPRDGDVTHCCLQLNMRSTMVDWELDHVNHDLLNQMVFDSILADVRRHSYHAVLMSPPCSTFSSARSGPGPKALRGEFAPDIYGLKSNSVDQRKLVSEGTILALRCNDVAGVCTTDGIPNLTETPGLKPGQPSVAKLPEVM